MRTTATTIHAIWSRELKLDTFDDTDDFFDLGGHSLIMAQIQLAIANELGVEVAMDELFRRSTVGEISQFVDSNSAALAGN